MEREITQEIEEQLEETQEHADEYLSGSRRWTTITLYAGGEHYSIKVTNQTSEGGDEHFIYDTLAEARYRHIRWEKEIDRIEEEELE